jgi:hypothetical protein
MSFFWLSLPILAPPFIDLLACQEIPNIIIFNKLHSYLNRTSPHTS